MYRQSSKMVISSLVMLIKSGLFAIALWMGLNNPVPPGIPNDACCNLPASFWNLLREILFDVMIFFVNILIFSHLGGGNWSVKFSPSSIQPSTSFLNSQRPSPLMSFGCDIGSCPLWPLTSGGGNTECTPCIIACDTVVRCVSVMLFVSPMKSSTKTSRSVTSSEVLCFDGGVLGAVLGSIRFSKV